ncbi:hypothetical protein GX50_06440, partial [[Emmonsia] crescens]
MVNWVAVGAAAVGLVVCVPMHVQKFLWAREERAYMLKKRTEESERKKEAERKERERESRQAARGVGGGSGVAEEAGEAAEARGA